MARKWEKKFNEKQLRKIESARVYASRIHSDIKFYPNKGHKSKMIIDKFSTIMDEIEIAARECITQRDKGEPTEDCLNELFYVILSRQ